MKNGHLLNNAIVFAATHHDGQLDRGGRPYILHPLAVMQNVGGDEERMAIAVLHDVIEDTKATYADLRAIGMTNRVINGVQALTKLPGQTYEEYKEQVKSNTDAVAVKKEDLRHNSDLRRLKGVTEKDIARVAKYMAFYAELEALSAK